MARDLCARWSDQRRRSDADLLHLGHDRAAVAAAAFVGAAGPSGATASSHREAPLIADDPAVDNTDLYAFVSPDKPDTVTIIANFIPFEDPAGGPNYYSFDPNARETVVTADSMHAF